MTRTRAGLALSILVLSLLLACSSTSETAKSQEPPTPPPLFVGVSPIYPPLAFIDANGEINGVEADFADLMAKQLGRPLTFERMQWSELIPALMGGKIDLIMSGMTDTPARRVQIDFCNPYMQTRIVTIMRARDKAKYNSIKAITETMANVGVVSGSTAEAMVRRRFPHARVMGYTSVENGVFDLKTMRIDLFVGEGPACLWAVSVNEGVLAGFWEPLQEEPLAWGVSRTNPEMKATANAVLTTWKQNGTLRRVLERWMPYIDKIQPPQPASPK